MGPENNASYTIVKFVGVRITYVKLTGSMSNKQVIIQPAVCKMKGRNSQYGNNHDNLRLFTGLASALNLGNSSSR